jgi:hypothetical protein
VYISFISFIELIASFFSLEDIVNGVFLISFSVCSLLMYKRATGFCILIFVPCYLLEVFMICNSFFFGGVFRVF